MKHKVTLRPSGKEVEIEEGEDLLSALRKQDVYIKSSCGGHASCTDCLIKVVLGEDHLTAPPFEEIQLLGNVFHITKERLACQAKVTGEVTIDISGHDKANDEARLRSKTAGMKPKLRKKEETDRIMQEREKAKEEREEQRPKRLDGNRRPKKRKDQK